MNTMENTDSEFQWGYSHSRNVDARGELVPITSDSRPRAWYDSREEAEAALRNDLRWRIATFIIRRPRPAQPEVIGREYEVSELRRLAEND